MGLFRFLLALTVALGHSAMTYGYVGMNGVLSVQAFYVVSGFLITFILCTKYDASTSNGLRLFYSNRALRIYLTYWIILGFALAPVVISRLLGGPTLMGGQNAILYYAHDFTPLTWFYIVFTNLFIVGQDVGLWLNYSAGDLSFVFDADHSVPHMSGFQIFPQAWSLAIELYFYALAPWIIRRTSKSVIVTIALVVGCYALRDYGSNHGAINSAWAYRFFPFELGLFMAGSLAFRFYALLDRLNVMRLIPSAVVTAAVAVTVCVHQYIYYLNLHPYYFLAGVAFAMPFLFDFSRRFAADRWLGELSFPLYLIHVSVNEYCTPIWNALNGPSISDNPSFSIAAVLTSISLSAAYVFFIDSALERWRQRRVAMRKMANGSKHQPAGVPAPSMS